MTAPPAPLRFLGAVVGGWIAVRSLALVPDWADEALPDVAAAERPASVAAASDPLPPAAETPAGLARAAAGHSGPGGFAETAATRGGFIPIVFLSAEPAALDVAQPGEPFLRTAAPGVAQLFPSVPAPPGQTRRWSGSAWILVRERGDPTLAPGGELGGSQAGLRLTYRLFGRRAPLALSGRVYLPLERPEGAEAAVGIDWRPLPSVPLNILAERREAIGREGRSDFALTLYGGGERRLGRLRVEAWGQAGAVGLDDPDLFADGLVRATTRLGPVDVGGGLWGGAQPGAARLDAGPHVSARLPIRGVNVRAMGEWRFRVAGDAAPASGPAFTLASDF
ncbi:hypothetical protein [Sphingosinicella sp. YJ22]|uniref:hypothetical protein n=1 Tax=Sphingosinicella sp. YJ22 TaxID=1104780 RepID=UPI0014085FD2|nr:hypothetical protein [Sphingosinicella sp. YJ22]